MSPDAIDVTGLDNPVKTFLSSISSVKTVIEHISWFELLITATWFLMVMFFVNPEEKVKQTVMFSSIFFGLYLVDKTFN